MKRIDLVMPPENILRQKYRCKKEKRAVE